MAASIGLFAIALLLAVSFLISASAGTPPGEIDASPSFRAAQPPEVEPDALPTTGSQPSPALTLERTEPSPSPGFTPPPGPDYLLIERPALQSLPTSGNPWEDLKRVADEVPGVPDLTDQDNRHGVRILAAALVYARTGDPAYQDTARAGIMSAVGTERPGADGSILALARQLGAYVLAADFIDLSGEDDQFFREWLAAIRTRELGGHGRWRQLTATHEDAPNNWGSFAGASRIAASLYLGDDDDVEQAAQVLRGFLGERTAWSHWQELDEDDAEWACYPDRFAPINPPCHREGIDLDGAIPADISRSGGLRWPPGEDGILYTNESLQGLSLQAELLRVAGYDAWQWRDGALERAALFLERAGGWNETTVSYHLAWLFNARYSLELRTHPAGYGRLLGYTDWLYGEH